MSNSAIYPSTLQPDSTELHYIDSKAINIPVVHLSFQQWTGDPIPNTFGGKGLINFMGTPMFAELAIQRTAVLGGWNARWVETYAMKGKVPYYFTQWGDCSLSQQVQDPISDNVQVELLETISKNNNGSYSGCWDVIAWQGDRTVFIESKRSKKDSFRSTQDQWLQAGLRAGLAVDNFLIVEWDYS